LKNPILEKAFRVESNFFRTFFEGFDAAGGRQDKCLFARGFRESLTVMRGAIWNAGGGETLSKSAGGCVRRPVDGSISPCGQATPLGAVPC
jgi:hypothetical protein